MVKKNDKKGKTTTKLNEKNPPKKRGRKPKGGKIITNIIKDKDVDNETKSNIILHLKHLSDSNIKNNEEKALPEYLNLNNMKKENYEKYGENKNTNNKSLAPSDKNIIWEKIKNLRYKLHNNDIDKRSACFWCTESFDNPPIHIPKNQKNNVTEVYGCFCSPECAVAYLKKEPLDSSVLWERYAMLNNIYSKIYNYTNNIKPAPCPYYTLEKYYGNMTIEEYRQILNKQYLLIVVDKPLTKVMPELYDDNNDVPTIYNNLLENKMDNNAIRLGRKNNNLTKGLF
tara:strand:- start:488 stop:1339 length:852 start_codon:yes stop_codon:yes gene_type:complete